MPTAIIADDEDLQRSDLRRMLALAWPELEIVALCEDGSEALDAIARLRPDIAFLDIRMPGLSGLEVAGASGGACRVVFTTAYDSHALEAFDLGAIDYLLKPVTQERLAQAVARLRERGIGSGNSGQADSAGLLQAMMELDRRLRASAREERIRWISATAG
ncbi:LytR/AlgR family response regulator transcription factor, partial [Massilia sp.]|uniref:LytR/AlgR family response regulator transcription factor n=3 Tax=unclassified Massilia TaxID=2609279 RepID=UPI0028AEEE22